MNEARFASLKEPVVPRNLPRIDAYSTNQSLNQSVWLHNDSVWATQRCRSLALASP